MKEKGVKHYDPEGKIENFSKKAFK